MGAIETYNTRVGFQEYLDAEFPRGAWITVIERSGNKLVPAGVELTTGRVFCSGAREREEGWEYQLMIDPRNGPQELQQIDQPFTCWIRELDDENAPLYEAEIVDDPESPFELIRLRSDPLGPRKPVRGQREFVTGLREAELFPKGLQLVKGVSGDSDTG